MPSSLRLPFRLCALLCTAFVCIGAVAADVPTPVQPIPADDFVNDHTQVEWAQGYLQWIAAFARDTNPLADATGAQCAAKQDGDVWFLAVSDGTAPVVRNCTIPAGKTLFVPIAGTVERSGNREPDCASMARIAAQTIDTQVGALSLAIDGVPVDALARHRLATGGCFALGLRQTPRLTAATAVGDGYFVMLKPLAPGAHTIASSARFGQATLSTTYHLDVH